MPRPSCHLHNEGRRADTVVSVQHIVSSLESRKSEGITKTGITSLFLGQPLRATRGDKLQICIGRVIMARPSPSSAIIRNDFTAFVWHAFKATHDEPLGNQLYLRHLCYEISKFIKGDTRRLLINLPPQHLKSFVGTICLAAYLLGTNPRLRIILVAYNDEFAEALCGKIRDLMKSDWYQATFATRIKDGHSRANDFGTQDGGGVFAASATGAITGRAAEVVIYDELVNPAPDFHDQTDAMTQYFDFADLKLPIAPPAPLAVIAVAHGTPGRGR